VRPEAKEASTTFFDTSNAGIWRSRGLTTAAAHNADTMCVERVRGSVVWCGVVWCGVGGAE
jgi:hypothetical protein